MDRLLYDKGVICPLCAKKFTTKKIKTTRLKMIKREDDFFTLYEGINPIYYYIWVCPQCGYSASESEYIETNPILKDIFNDKISSKWSFRDFGGIRSIDMAEQAYKLALLTGQLMNKPKGYMGGICLRLAWIYREMSSDRENKFLKHALNYFTDAYHNERLPANGLDSVSLAYLIGELSRRLGYYKESIQWYNKTLDDPDIKKKRLIQLKAREQWQLAKEQYDEKKQRKNNA